MATGTQAKLPGTQNDLGESLGYAIKRRLLGPPLVNEQLSEERLSKPLALGVLAPDGISSSAYGTEEILIELLKGGLAITAFALILPITGVVLFVMALVVLSYREVVTVYTRAGGSYVVARENFGPKVAQVAAVALLIDYVVTVAVQIAAGTAAVASAIPVLNNPQLITIISIGVVLLMLYGNLRGIREAGRSFAIPTYLFSGVMMLVIVVGLGREFFGGGLPKWSVAQHAASYGTSVYGRGVPASHSALISFGLVFVLLRAFANGGSSLTGIEAVSNAVSAFQPPEGLNARKVLVAEGMILGTLVAGISWLAHITHATPYTAGVPTVISQEAALVFGSAGFGKVMFFVVQAATALILYTGGNTSFNGFPFLASFVAEDAFLPRWLTKRGHRLVFSNGMIVLAVLSCTLLAVAGANVNALVPFYALGVFTAFTLAGFGMARYHHKRRERGWQHKLVINFAAGVTSLVVVLIFAVVKFTEGAWLVLIVFAIGVPALIRLNRHYRMEAEVLEHISTGDHRRARPATPPTYSRRTVYVFVDEFDLATLAGLRYARSLRPTSLRAVHFVIDSVQANRLRDDWVRANTGVTLDLVDCPDRRIARAAADMVSAEASLPGVGVTAVMPRRTYAPMIGRLLHDRTADRMASVVSQIPHAAATIVPFDVRTRVESLAARAHVKATAAASARDAEGAGPDEAGREGAGPDQAMRRQAMAEAVAEATKPEAPATGEGPDVRAGSGDRPEPVQGSPTPPGADIEDGDGEAVANYKRPVPSKQATPIGRLPRRGKAVVEGRVHAVEIRPVEHNTVLACEIVDATGQLTALFYGRSHIPGLDPGAKVRLTGQVGVRDREAVMVNPAYELLAPGTGSSTPS
ncbi:MAG TPA: amino acid permease [Streptosporangiaceae bacterium]